MCFCMARRLPWNAKQSQFNKRAQAWLAEIIICALQVSAALPSVWLPAAFTTISPNVRKRSPLPDAPIPVEQAEPC